MYSCTHSLWVKVLFDGEAVHHTGGQALLHAGQEQHRQGKDLEVHSRQNPSQAQVSLLDGVSFKAVIQGTHVEK